MRRRRLAVTDEDATALRLEPSAVPDERFALPVHVPQLFLLLTRHPDHCQLARVPLKVATESLTQRGGIAGVGLHAGALLVELARGDHVTVRPDLLQAR